MISQPDATTKR